MALDPKVPDRTLAGEEHTGRTCPYCRFPLKAGGELMVCGHCHSAHHLDCWIDNGGCAVMACAGGPGKSTGEATVVMPAATATAEPGIPQPTVSYGQGVPSTPAPPAPYPPPPGGGSPSGGNNNRGLIAALMVLALAIGGVAVALLLSKGKPSSSRAASISPGGVTVAAPASSGVTSNTGQTGSTGSTGNSGTTGSTGNSGSTGSTGSTGNSGSTGSTGSTGNSGTGSTGSTGSTTSTGNSGGGSTGSNGAGSTSSPAGALDTYWSDIDSGDDSDAYDLETPSEQHDQSVSDMQQNQAKVNIIWTKPGGPDSAGQTARINFYTVASDGVCRHFSIESQMVRSGGGWLYDGVVPGSDTIDKAASGNSSCPS